MGAELTRDEEREQGWCWDWPELATADDGGEVSDCGVSWSLHRAPDGRLMGQTHRTDPCSCCSESSYEWLTEEEARARFSDWTP